MTDQYTNAPQPISVDPPAPAAQHVVQPQAAPQHVAPPAQPVAAPAPVPAPQPAPAPAVAMSQEQAMANFRQNSQRLDRENPEQGASFLTFKQGDWRMSRGETSLKGRRVVFNTLLVRLGFTLWVDSKRVDQRMAPMCGDPKDVVHRNQLPNGGEGWQDSVSLSGRMMDGDEENFIYDITSKGGNREFTRIRKLIDRQIDQGLFISPVCTLDTGKYLNKNHGNTIFVPVLTVIDWMDLNGNLLGGGGGRIDPAGSIEAQPMAAHAMTASGTDIPF